MLKMRSEQQEMLKSNITDTKGRKTPSFRENPLEKGGFSFRIYTGLSADVKS